MLSYTTVLSLDCDNPQTSHHLDGISLAFTDNMVNKLLSLEDHTLGLLIDQLFSTPTPTIDDSHVSLHNARQFK